MKEGIKTLPESGKMGGIETFLGQSGPHLPRVLLIEPRHVMPGVVFPEGSELLTSGFLPQVSAHHPRYLAQPSETQGGSRPQPSGARAIAPGRSRSIAAAGISPAHCKALSDGR